MMEEHIKDAFHYASFDRTILAINIVNLFEWNIYNKIKYIKRKRFKSYKMAKTFEELNFIKKTFYLFM